MTDRDLAPLAKDGVTWAVNELLRRCLPEVRSIVWSMVSRQRATFSIYDDAVSQALCAVWRSIPAWDPKVSLVAFSRLNIAREVWRVAAKAGHAVSIPVARSEGQESSRHQALRHARSLDYPPPSDPDAAPLREILPASNPDIDAIVDGQRVLSALGAQDVERLLAGFAGEERNGDDGTASLARQQGITREMGRRLHNRAQQRLDAITKARGLR